MTNIKDKIKDEMVELIKSDFVLPRQADKISKSILLCENHDFENRIGTNIEDFLDQYQTYSSFKFDTKLWKEVNDMTETMSQIIDMVVSHIVLDSKDDEQVKDDVKIENDEQVETHDRFLAIAKIYDLVSQLSNNELDDLITTIKSNYAVELIEEVI